jgi:uncharacterized SAM-binding protein YcdF (DUF218 family)
MKKISIFFVLNLTIIFVIFIASIIFLYKISYSNSERKYFISYPKIVGALEKYLVVEKHVSSKDSTKVSETTAVIYVLGGNQDSLTSRFREASNLYHQGLSNKILILSRPGITEFSPDLGRNMTNNEWAIRELEILHVNKQDIEPVSVEKSIFGTLSEAEALTKIVQRKGYKKLILVSSAYHTRRVLDTFSNIASGSPLELYIYGSTDIQGIPSLTLEYLKLIIYDSIVLPAIDWKRGWSRGSSRIFYVNSTRAN